MPQRQHDKISAVGGVGATAELWNTRISFDAARCKLIQKVYTIVAALFFVLWPVAALAGGACLLHPEPFKLRSDTVRWLIKIKPGNQCIQGLRWSTIMIENIAIIEEPKSGRLLVQGPAFRYFSNPGAVGNDSFKISITGTSMRINGTSSIEVEVVTP